MKRIVLSLLVDNNPGVLARVASLFSRRGYNIDSITAGETNDPKYTRITVTVRGDNQILAQIRNQINKLEEVRKIIELDNEQSVCRELVLVKVNSDRENRNAIIAVTSTYHASLVNIGENSLTFRASGTPSQIDTLIQNLAPFGILEMARTGIAALENGDSCLADGN